MFGKHGMNSQFAVLGSAKDYMLASSAVFRRQQFLIRSLGGYTDQSQQKIMQQTKALGGTALEADAEHILRAITPPLDRSKHKGQAGMVAVIGGCREYTGAPYFAAISALKIGADLSHVFCTKDAAPVIKSYSPELIVHPVLEESYSVRDEDKQSISMKVFAEVVKWMERFDCLVVGPGLGRDPFLLVCVSEIMKHARKCNVPIVVDGQSMWFGLSADSTSGLFQDGLFLVTNNLDLVSGYSLAVLTPNVNEYKRLVEKVLNCEVKEQDAYEQLLSLAKGIGGVTILRKGKSDLISDGETVKSVSIYGSPRRCGGQGDILSGRQVSIYDFLLKHVAVFVSWARERLSAAEGDSSISKINPTILGSIAGSALLRKAASLAFQNKKRSTLTGDIIEHLGRSLEDICPAS
ncbi:ATP-dependent (S)-NAD(P)H-hydrate dehydratase [Morella rubra]|uniref:ATP-dependent (S)-NAD(P)H-hydrate dehydratase n=1 Tax=Morella rubra TaxID=262757 RepID=A0A6A1VUA5_9ROSI|nr:ATP-dependent (S)-NAD(P)H-hydrate dehydratase [Morella rubra]